MKLLKAAWEKWLKFAHVIGNFQGQVIFTIFYFLLLFPVGVVISLFSDPLNIKQKRKSSNFNKWEHLSEGLGDASKPY